MRFSAAIRTAASEVGAGALLFLKFLPKSDGAESDLFAVPIVTVASSPQPVQSARWARIAVEAVLPEAADSIVIGLVMTGNGAAWFGDLEFAAINRSDEVGNG